MPDLKQFAQHETDVLVIRRNQAQQALGVAQDAVSLARAAKEDRTVLQAEQLRILAGLRLAIAAAPMPVDMAKLAATLSAALVELRKRRSDLLDAEEKLAEAEAELESARVESESAAAGLPVAQERLQRETERQDRHARWGAMLLEEPVVSVQDRAGEVLISDLFQEAKDRVEEIPKKLRDSAVARLNRELDRQPGERGVIEGVEDVLARLVADEQGHAGKAAQEWLRFLRAEAKLGAWAQGANARLDQAVGLLEKVRSGPRLTDQEKDDLAAIASANSKAAEKAADQEKAVVDARNSLDARIRARDQKRIELLAKDIEADVENDLAFIPLQDSVTQADLALKKEKDDFTAEMQAALEAWESAVPDGVWDSLAAFRKAQRILEELTGADLGDLGTDLITAESHLLTALQDESKTARALDFLRGHAERLRVRLRHTQNLQEPRIARAVRGDA